MSVFMTDAPFLMLTQRAKSRPVCDLYKHISYWADYWLQLLGSARATNAPTVANAFSACSGQSKEIQSSPVILGRKGWIGMMLLLLVRHLRAEGAQISLIGGWKSLGLLG
jgi:hypothetical protein